MMELVDIEKAYDDKIDCRLNYHDVGEMMALFDEAKSISTVCVFRFLEELARPPSSFNNRSRKLQNNILAVLDHVDLNFNHPLKAIVFMLIVDMLNGDRLPIKKTLKLINTAKKYNCYPVLSILHSSYRFNGPVRMIENE